MASRQARWKRRKRVEWRVAGLCACGCMRPSDTYYHPSERGERSQSRARSRARLRGENAS